MQDLIGQSLGRYHIIERLGEGGMATVYKAFDTRLERDVVVKVIRREAFSPDVVDRMLQRFEREAKALSKLIHANIVPIIDYGDEGGSPYLVMPLIDGGTLKDKLAGQVFSAAEAARILAPIARALDYAHSRGILHRDVKPSNILLTNSGDPMLSDFGVAKILEEGESATLTGTGMGLGTPEYMAPEQWVGKATPASDQYSLGVVFYEMITGHKPYTAETPAAVLLKQATESLPRPRVYVQNLPEEAEKVLFKVLAKEPALRYASMTEFADALVKSYWGTSKTGTRMVNTPFFTKKKESDQTVDGGQRGLSSVGQTSEGQSKKHLKPLLLWGSGAILILLVLLVFIFNGNGLRMSGLFNTATPQITMTPTPNTPIIESFTVQLPLDEVVINRAVDINEIFLMDMEPKSISVGFYQYCAAKFCFSAAGEVTKGNAMSFNGQTFSHAIFAHAPSRYEYQLNQEYSTFESYLFHADNSACGDGLVFQIYGDNKKLFLSDTFLHGTTPLFVKINIRNVKTLTLITTEGSNMECDWAIWGNPILTKMD